MLQDFKRSTEKVGLTSHPVMSKRPVQNKLTDSTKWSLLTESTGDAHRRRWEFFSSRVSLKLNSSRAKMSSVWMPWTSEEGSMCFATDTADQGLNNGGRLKHREIYTVFLVQCVTKQWREIQNGENNTVLLLPRVAKTKNKMKSAWLQNHVERDFLIASTPSRSCNAPSSSSILHGSGDSRVSCPSSWSLRKFCFALCCDRNLLSLL